MQQAAVGLIGLRPQAGNREGRAENENESRDGSGLMASEQPAPRTARIATADRRRTACRPREDLDRQASRRGPFSARPRRLWRAVRYCSCWRIVTDAPTVMRSRSAKLTLPNVLERVKNPLARSTPGLGRRQSRRGTGMLLVPDMPTAPDGRGQTRLESSTLTGAARRAEPRPRARIQEAVAAECQAYTGRNTDGGLPTTASD